jgi:membrane-bound lytic murein transglycosylase A
MRALAVILLLALAACSTSDETVLNPVKFRNLMGWKKDQQAEALGVFVKSCIANKTRPNAWRTKTDIAVGDAEAWGIVCDKAEMLAAIEPSDDLARQFFQDNFTPVRVMTGREPRGQMTGYYEPLLRGAAKKGGPYQTPVYGVPRGNKHFTRAEIEAGALRKTAPVLLYVDDPVMLFFLHIQGSGKVLMNDGSMVGLQFAGQNGYEYFAIGKTLKDMGEIAPDKVSLQTIRDWLNTHPGAPAKAVMDTNPSYIFFKLSPGDEYAKGALGIPLTPLRSIAVDDDRAAYGVPTYINTTRVNHEMGYEERLRRLFVSQDTGGALHGPHRADIFFGRGMEEEWSAGHQNSRGKVYWLLPKPPAPPVQ